MISQICARFKRFRRDEEGSVTIQVMFFSLMVFGATGIVLDAGRVYDSHSQMQIYADHMALLAANELDRQPDSIERATNAVYANAGDDATMFFGSDVNAGNYNVDSLSFYSDMDASVSLQNDMSGAFPPDYLLTTTSEETTSAIAQDSEDAAFVVVTVSSNVNAVTKFMTKTIANVGEPGDYGDRFGNTRVANADAPEQFVPDSFDLTAVAAATLERESCAEISNLVMCNPWEDQDDANNPLLLDQDDIGYSVPGRSLMYFAANPDNVGVPPDGIVENGENHGSLFPWDIHHQLFQIDSPVADPAGICTGDFLRNLAGEVVSGDASTQEYIEARDRCIMARANAPQMCWSDANPLTIRPANGDTVLRSINTIFDIWLAPFDTMIANATIIGTVTLDDGTTHTVTAADFFAPDILATTTYETADRFGIDDEGDTDAQCEFPEEGSGIWRDCDYLSELVQDGIPDYNLPWPHDDPTTDDGDPNTNEDDESHPDNVLIDGIESAYDTIPKPGWTYSANFRGEAIGYDNCHETTLGRQDNAAQDRAACLLDAQNEDHSEKELAEAEEQCEAEYSLAASYASCAIANPDRVLDACGCTQDFVGDHHLGGSPLNMFPRTQGHRNSMYDFGDANPNVSFPITFAGPNSWYEYYQLERAAQSSISTRGGLSRVVRWNGVDTDTVQDAVADYGLPEADETDMDDPDGHTAVREGYIKHYPDDFLALTGNQPSALMADPTTVFMAPDRERRRLQSAMVNCGIVTGQLQDDDGSTRSPNADGTYDVTLDDMYVMDAYIPNPAGMFCGHGDASCDVVDSVETTMFIELIEDITEDATADQFIVRLVR